MNESDLHLPVFAFEDTGHELEFLPLAARRALDCAGLRLSLAGWRSLAIEERRALSVAGAPEVVDTALVASIVGRASPPPERIERAADPDPAAPPDGLPFMLKQGEDLDTDRWVQLRSLDRYALVHAYRKALKNKDPSILSVAFDAVAPPRAKSLAAPSVQMIAAAWEQEPATIPTMPPVASPATTANQQPAPAVALAGFPERASTTLVSASAPQESSDPGLLSTHLTPSGKVRMVDVGAKPETQRRAVASAVVKMRRETVLRIARSDTPKGEVLATARVAGIMAAKRTPDLIPLCHGIALTHASVHMEVNVETAEVRVTATTEAMDRTGVEMEAMVAVSVACLTIYDMLKGIDREMTISEIKLMEKSGGKSGHFRREEGPA